MDHISMWILSTSWSETTSSITITAGKPPVYPICSLKSAQSTLKLLPTKLLPARNLGLQLQLLPRKIDQFLHERALKNRRDLRASINIMIESMLERPEYSETGMIRAKIWSRNHLDPSRPQNKAEEAWRAHRGDLKLPHTGEESQRPTKN